MAQCPPFRTLVLDRNIQQRNTSHNAQFKIDANISFSSVLHWNYTSPPHCVISLVKTYNEEI